MKLSKFNPDSVFEEYKDNEDFHAPLRKLMEEIDTRIGVSGSKEDIKLMESLKQFYVESDLYKVAGEELLKEKDVR
jgi:hypothetical protein